ncbi:MAG: hypothetical protein KDC87_21135, partial [Planctomycetes bacterium]|nr:hypothetical protein [Planctomycetota bacterium]
MLHSKTLCRAFVGLSFLTALSAQQAVTIPAFQSVEAPAWSTLFGALPGMRYQLLEGGFRGAGAKLVTELAFRGDGAAVVPFAFERTWTSVQLGAAEAEFDGFTRDMDRNHATPYVALFNAAVRWPRLGNNPNPGTPRPWGAHATFPFQQPYAYTGQRDLLFDFRFSGGAMPQYPAWSHNDVVPYPFDADGVGGTAESSFQVVGRQECRDPYTNELPMMWAIGSVFAAGVTPKPLSNTLSLSAFGIRTAPLQPVVSVVSLSPVLQGSVVPGVCQRLYLDLAQPFVALGGLADSVGSAEFRFGLVAWQDAYAGQDVWTQGAYPHPITGTLALTMSGHAQLPTRQTNVYRRVATWGLGATARTGVEPSPGANL